MKIKITGNKKELQDKIDSFRANLKTELVNKRKHYIIIHVSFLSLGLLSLIGCLLCSFMFGSVAVIISVVVCFTLLLTYCMLVPSDYVIQNHREIENEVTETTRWLYYNEMSVLNLFYEGKLLSARVLNYKQGTFNDFIKLKFSYKRDNGLVGYCYISTRVNETTNIENKGAFQVDLETGYSTLYYDDVLSPGQSLEIING